MEFFAFADIPTTQETIRTRLSLASLPSYCTGIEAIEDEGELDMVVYFSHWGRFHIRSETVMGGVRFSIPDCPNALAWTVTTGYPPCPDKIVLHATINRPSHDEEFIRGVEHLLAAFKNGLEDSTLNKQAEKTVHTIHLMDLRQ